MMVRYEHLQGNVRDRIDEVVNLRSERLPYVVINGGVFSVASAIGANVLGGYMHRPGAAGAFCGVLGATALRNMHEFSLDVARSTKFVGDEIGRAGLVGAKYVSLYPEITSVKELAKTHLVVIDGRKNVHVIPATMVQRALAAAQQTFLKTVAVPFVRTRVKIRTDMSYF